MKKLISLLIVCSLLTSLSACKPQGPGGATNPPTNPTEPNNFKPGQETMFSVALPAVTKYGTAQDGTVLLSYTYQSMSLTHPDPDVADKVIRDFLSRVDATRSTAYSLYDAAKSAYAGNGNWNPYLLSITYNPTRIDQSVLSLFGSSITFNGTAHPEPNLAAANYDLLTGDILTLGSIMSANATKDDFIRLVLESLSKIEEESQLFGGYESSVRQRFNRNESTDQDFYFTSDGLCFYFEPYEIAPYTSGVIVAEIPYAKLAGIIYDGYFPAERDTVSSTISASKFAETDVTGFSQITEAILDTDGEMFFLYTDGLLWDVQLDVGTWDIAGTEFNKQYTALLSHALSPGDAIMIQSKFTDVMPVLRLTYRIGTMTVTKFISQSGEDGSILLTDN